MVRPPQWLSQGANAEDENILAEQGYKQELQRDWGLLHNFGVSFSIIVSAFETTKTGYSRLTDEQSVITGITTLCIYIYLRSALSLPGFVANAHL